MFSFRRKQVFSSQMPCPSKTQKYSPTPLYDYFNENSDEIMQIQCIYFSLSDIFFIINLINKDVGSFRELPKYEYFKKTLVRIQDEEYKLDKQLSFNKKYIYN